MNAMMKKLALLLAVVLLVAGLGTAALAKGSHLGYLTVINCSNWVTLRSAPSTSAGTVTRVPLGAEVDGYYYNSQFTECYYNGYHGYILSTYLTGGARPEHYVGPMYVINCNEFVTLRRSPSTSSGTVTKVALGEMVDVYDCGSASFYRCVYNNLEGYILKKYLGSYKPKASPKSGSNSWRTLWVVNCDSWVSLRNSPSTSASRATKVPLGAKVYGYKYNNSWYYCEYGHYNGYILAKYITD